MAIRAQDVPGPWLDPRGAPAVMAPSSLRVPCESAAGTPEEAEAIGAVERDLLDGLAPVLGASVAEAAASCVRDACLEVASFPTLCAHWMDALLGWRDIADDGDARSLAAYVRSVRDRTGEPVPRDCRRVPAQTAAALAPYVWDVDERALGRALAAAWRRLARPEGETTTALLAPLVPDMAGRLERALRAALWAPKPGADDPRRLRESAKEASQAFQGWALARPGKRWEEVAEEVVRGGWAQRELDAWMSWTGRGGWTEPQATRVPGWYRCLD